MAAELKSRRWIGVEIGPTEGMRFDRIKQERAILDDYRKNLNSLLPEDALKQRVKVGLWTCESVRDRKRRCGRRGQCVKDGTRPVFL